MTHIIVIRHCEAFGNIMRVFQGRSDGDISENGKAQLEKLAVHMKQFPFDVVYASPLKRAQETARAVNQFMNRPFFIEEGLVEIDGGHWEGNKWVDLPKLYPQESGQWNLEPWNFHPAGGESMRQVYDRIYETVQGLARKHTDQTVVAVSHGCAIRNLLCRVKGYPIERLNEIEWCDNTGINRIDFDEALQPHLVLENDNSHLDEELSTLGKQSWWTKENREKLIFE